MRTSTKPVNDNVIMQRIMETMTKRGIRQKELMESIGVATPVFSKWKYNTSKSYLNHLSEIAKCLHVTPDYLRNGVISDETNYSIEDYELLHRLQRLSKAKK